MPRAGVPAWCPHGRSRGGDFERLSSAGGQGAGALLGSPTPLVPSKTPTRPPQPAPAVRVTTFLLVVLQTGKPSEVTHPKAHTCPGQSWSQTLLLPVGVPGFCVGACGLRGPPWRNVALGAGPGGTWLYKGQDSRCYSLGSCPGGLGFRV